MPAKLNDINTALRVCVDRVEDGCISGQVYSQSLAAPLMFPSLRDMLLQIDGLLTRQNFPRAYQRARSFLETEPRPALCPVPEGHMSLETVEASYGCRATFVLHIVSRRNATWQGRVDWLDGAPEEPFYSVLELLRRVAARLGL